MPIPYKHVQLYDLNEMTGQLRIETLQGEKPLTKIVQISESQWIIEIHRGMLPNLTLLGYLRETKAASPRVFQSSDEAFKEISWCDDFIRIML